MKKQWFAETDGSGFFRNLPLIMAERRSTPRINIAAHRELSAEFAECWRAGVLRKSVLGPGDVVVEPESFQMAYPRHPILWTLDEVKA